MLYHKTRLVLTCETTLILPVTKVVVQTPQDIEGSYTPLYEGSHITSGSLHRLQSFIISFCKSKQGTPMDPMHCSGNTGYTDGPSALLWQHKVH